MSAALVDAYYRGRRQWREELLLLRQVALESGLEEAFKWRVPCYCHQGKNIAMLGGFKDYCVVSFFKGVLLDDPAGLLQLPGPNTQAARVMRFTSLAEVERVLGVLPAYLAQAIDVELAGERVVMLRTRDMVMPEELAEALQGSAALNEAFAGLTPGRQRDYYRHIGEAKQATTRRNRVERHRARMLAGLGLNDCTCGLSQRMPSCDGSHRVLGPGKPPVGTATT